MPQKATVVIIIHNAPTDNCLITSAPARSHILLEILIERHIGGSRPELEDAHTYGVKPRNWFSKTMNGVKIHLLLSIDTRMWMRMI